MTNGSPGHGAILRVFQINGQRLLDNIGRQWLVTGIVVELGNGQIGGRAVGGRREFNLAAQVAGRICHTVGGDQQAQHGAVGVTRFGECFQPGACIAQGAVGRT